MSEQYVKFVHFTNTIKVAIMVKTKTLFFEALNLRIWLSIKPVFDLHIVCFFVEIIVVFILCFDKFMIKNSRRTDKSSI